MLSLPRRGHAVVAAAAVVTAAVLSAPAALAAGTPGVDPAHVEVTLAPGASTTLTKTVTTPAILPRPDIYFLADTTGSMGGAIANVASNATSILNQVATATTDPQFGVGEYKDFPYDPFAYRNDQVMSGDKDAVTAAITGNWVASGGADGSEAQLYALHKLLGSAGFRSDSSRIVVWFGDAPGHDPVCASISGESADVTEASVTAELVAAKVKVLAVSVDTGLTGGLNADPKSYSGDYTACSEVGGQPDQATRIAAATGGQVFTGVPPEEVAQTIVDGLKALPATVTPSAACDEGVSATFTPAEVTVDSGAAATFEETLHAATDATAGARHCTVTFLVNGKPGGDAFVESNVITVPALDRAPDCTKATATPAELWPVNHKFRTVTLAVPDPDGDAVTTTVTGVTQDEALNAGGDGSTVPDAAPVTGHPDQVQLRAERSGQGDGRVYRVAVSATDGKLSCTGTVAVSVPHDRSGQPAVDTTTVVVDSFGKS